MQKSDFLVIGSGIAGVTAALFLAKLGSVALISKKKLLSGATPLAQGGIAMSFGADADAHFSETLAAGHFQNKKSAVKKLIAGIPAARDFLENTLGVRFDPTLHREGGHSTPRVFHLADRTGFFLAQKLSQKVRENPKIAIFEHHFFVDFLTENNRVFGAAIFDGKKTKFFFAKKTILATGGAGQIFAATTNPPESTGDGLAAAMRAGVRVENFNRFQFHPTALCVGKSPLFLLSEALRGEGAKIIDEKNTEICDPLLPRDAVCAAIFERKSFLDLRHRRNLFWKKHFPTIFQKLADAGFSPESDPIPICPAAHFFGGGVATDLFGKTSAENLFAVGEVADTGVHGENRLASNSLLEALVFARAIFDFLKTEKPSPSKILPPFSEKKFFPETENDAKIRREIQKIMTKYFGVVRQKSDFSAVKKLKNLSPIGTETKNLKLVAVARAENLFEKEKTFL